MSSQPGKQTSSKASSGSAGLTIQRRLALGAAITFLVAGLGVWALKPRDPPRDPLPDPPPTLAAEKPAERELLGLMTTMPIYWGEAAGVDELIAGTAEPHWARDILESTYVLVPLDSLASGEDAVGIVVSLDDLDHVVLAQPRPLSGAENVALDDWVRRGGQVLLFADPLMTGHSRFSLGDRRRPQDVILLSPILTRWGLSLQFDDTQSPGERVENIGDIAVPVNLAGTFKKTPSASDAPVDCVLLAKGVAADCTIGKGRALIIADAAVLDQDTHEHATETLHKDALRNLVKRAFSAR